MMATISPGTASPELGRRICLRTCVAGSTTCSGQGIMSTAFTHCAASHSLVTMQQHVPVVEAQLVAEPASVREAADPVNGIPDNAPINPWQSICQRPFGGHQRDTTFYCDLSTTSAV